IEVYDNSHIQGSHAIGAMIVADREGFRKSAYRTFNIKGSDVTPGDDIAMMREVLGRRFKRLQKEDPEMTSGDWPDLILIDGGRTQLGAVMDALGELGITELPTVAISKGPDRNAGREQFHMPDRESFTLPPDHPVMYFLQRLRDESHRFAIGTHRAKRTKSLKASPLDSIPSIGPGRKRALLHHFGSAKAVEGAGVKDLTAVTGISKAMAQNIYDFFHERG
ncbi:MAG: excinuclease ABC subunit C, partial [Sphingomonadales bacterium]|nr:excinuclease ABC subunit C [Sphingomonadales bacterium]